MLNLCSNAIKFTNQGQIILKVTYTKAFTGPDNLIFQIADSGVGLSEEMKSHLFEPFFQDSSGGEFTKGGTGLGLSISKHLVELMGGKLFVESEAGMGSTFGFNLPISSNTNVEIEKVWGASTWAQSTQPEVSRVNTLTLEPSYQGKSAICETLKTFEFGTCTTDSAHRAMALLVEQSANYSENFVVFLDMVRWQNEANTFLAMLKNSNLANSIKVIQVEAQEGTGDKASALVYKIGMPIRRKPVYNQRVLLLFLQDLGFDVDISTDGVEAVQAFKSKHYDLVLLDCQMPRLSGFETAIILKEIQERRGILTPVIAVTASALEGTREECMANHMDDYLSKPIEIDKLFSLLRVWLY